MFKDAYKSANDDISPNPYLLTRILNKSEEKQRAVFYNFRFVPVAAIIALALVLPGIIHNPADTGTQVLNQPLPSSTAESGTYSFLPKNSSDDFSSADSKTNYQDNAASNTENYAEEKSEITTDNTSANMVVMCVNNVAPIVDTAAYARVSDVSPEALEEIPVGQYFEILGLKPDIFTLPDTVNADFDLNSSATVVRQDGDIISHQNTFTWSGSNYLSLTTSSETDTATSYLESQEYEKSIFNNKKAVVLFDGSIYEAYLIHNGEISVKIVTDMPEDDLKNFIISITKQ